MTDVELNAMKVAELKTYCEENGIVVQAENLNKPTKKEYVAAIENIEDIEVTKKDVVEEKPKKKVLSKAEKKAIKRKVQISELMPKVRVIIRDNRKTQTPSEFEWLTWGNDLIGHQTEKIVFDTPWHVRVGALRILEKATCKISVPGNFKDGKKPTYKKGPMYSIERLAPLTKQELKKLGERQTIIENNEIELIN